jgi:Protein of unknown function (DUF3037)
MPEENSTMFRYRVLRYMPNLIRDEWLNIGVLLEETLAANGLASPRRAFRVIESDTDFARIRRLHPGADENLLRSLGDEFDARLRAPAADAAMYLEKLDQNLSNILQLSPSKAVLASSFEAELDRLFDDHVAAPRSARGGIIENTRRWIRTRVNDILRRHRLLDRMEHSVRVDEFTQPGDPMRIDYAYRYNGTRGYIQTVPLGGHPSQAKVLAYTVDSIRKRQANSRFAAITDVEPVEGNARHQFVVRLLQEQEITVISVARADRFVSELRPRLQ